MFFGEIGGSGVPFFGQFRRSAPLNPAAIAVSQETVVLGCAIASPGLAVGWLDHVGGACRCYRDHSLADRAPTILVRGRACWPR